MRTFFLFAVPAILALAPVAAQAHKDNHCKDDVEKFCKDEKGNKAMHSCLFSHKAELTEECQKSHAKQFAKMEKAEAAKK